MGIRCMFHIHTRRSSDSMMSPRAILDRARKLDIHLLIVTDHETIRGSEDVANLTNGNPAFVLRAGEYKTEKGDIVGLFLQKEITVRNSDELLAEIRRQGGLSVLPHPYKSHRLDDALLSQIDLIEVHNARCSESQNRSAAALAESLRKPVMGGCDAHCVGELGAALMDFACDPPADEQGLRAMLLTAPRTVVTKKVSRAYQPYSQMIKACKTRNPLLFAYQAKQLATVLAREALSQ
jgi:predicted metal-dependent phosphoesterase TrpH